ncbi:hypothetical protein BDQ94DRAFT_35264 [Aspergillus welwitschiae]|uniref:Uncharacterized protein n=1 Tax=Aspergillus welwitschiae TaxID=1341132 RepID=A0A3F3Q343_9EURO|nr:hypothetical protein BDQ94DRAFT_35264 [Aspergillus welwitschiae]RDH33402.1 hypothetical protein BDQ94DRAFT_35264 [Aspergillus welwitschiae]
MSPGRPFVVFFTFACYAFWELWRQQHSGLGLVSCSFVILRMEIYGDSTTANEE